MRNLPSARMVVLLLALTVFVVACGSSGGTPNAGGSPNSGGSADGGSTPSAGGSPDAAASAATGGGGTAGTDPCNLATPDMVVAAFGGTSSDGVPGVARNCTFTLTGGSVPSVDVFYYGTAPEWDGIRAGFEDNREGTTDVSGIGSQAFHPNDAGPTELVILAGDTVYSVSAGFGASDEVNADVAELATAIAGTLGG
jgi:hypothetical protein